MKSLQPIQQRQQALRRDKGFSLVELMVSLTLGALLLTGIIQVFNGTRAAYETQDNLSRMQENGRFAFYFLARELRQAGYFGCAKTGLFYNNLALDDAKEAFTYDLETAIDGYAPGEALPAALDLDPARDDNSDVLIIRSASNKQVVLQPNTPPGSAMIHVETPHDLKQGDIVALSDCVATNVVQITNIKNSNVSLVHNTGTGSVGNDTQNLTHPTGNYDDDATVSAVNTMVFYIGENPAGRLSLYRTVNGGAAQELVEGVERMRLSYGVDTNEDRVVDEYRDADAVVDWGRVVSAQVSLLLPSHRDNVLDEEQTVSFHDGNLSFNDGRLRHVLNTTVALRNRAR